MLVKQPPYTKHNRTTFQNASWPKKAEYHNAQSRGWHGDERTCYTEARVVTKEWGHTMQKPGGTATKSGAGTQREPRGHRMALYNAKGNGHGDQNWCGHTI